MRAEPRWISTNERGPHCSIIIIQAALLPHLPCTGFLCRPGRECRAERGQEPHCVCTSQCPHHWKPVCGSDGVTYHNHCSLHRAACNLARPLSPRHPGLCRDGREEQEQEQEQEQEEHQTPVALPKACFENDRNRFSPDMSFAEKLWAHFYSSDVSGDSYVDSQELLDYLNHNQTDTHHLRQLCLDALVEEGDENFDWRLSYGEFKRLLSQSFEPSVKVCVLNGRNYKDGAETVLDCNGCACACGKWICTGEKCPEKHQQRNSVSLNSDSPVEDEREEDGDIDGEEYDEEEPEDDPDVQDVNWF